MPKEPKTPLPYEQPSHAPGVTRGQFRILLLLILLHLVVTVQSTYAPGVAEQLKRAWADHRQKVAEQAARAAEVRKQLALEQQCSAFTRPPGTIVWEENPAASEKLLAETGYHPADAYNVESLTGAASSFPRMAIASDPPLLEQLVSADPEGLKWVRRSYTDDLSTGGPKPGQKVLVLLHRLTSPAGRSRLACVFFQSSQWVEKEMRPDSDTHQEEGKLKLIRAFDAATCTLPDGQSPPQLLFRGRALDLYPEAEPLVQRFRNTPSADPKQPGKVEIQGGGGIRVYAGQPDPADASHFTVAYELDGRAGTIDGSLKDDDTIHLVPREGKVQGGRWYPGAK